MPNLKRSIPEHETKAEEFVREASLSDLVEMLGELERELGLRNIAKSSNLKLELAKAIFCTRFGWTRHGGGMFDARSPTGEKILVAAAKHEWKEKIIFRHSNEFDHLAVMIFDAQYSVRRAFLIEFDTVLDCSTSCPSGLFLHIDDAMERHDGVREVTHLMQWQGINDTSFGFDNPSAEPDAEIKS